MPDAGVPREFNVILEQYEHGIYVFMTAEFANGFVTPTINGVWSDGQGTFQIDLSFDLTAAAITTGRGQVVLVWTTIGNPPDGPCTIYIKEARSRTLLKIVNFTRLRRVSVASDANATLFAQHLISDIPLGMVPNDILPSARFYAPRTFNHTDTSANFWPAFVKLSVKAGTNISNVNVSLTSAVPGLTITATTPQQQASMSAGEEFPVTYRLEGIDIAVGVHDLDYNVTYDTPTGQIQGQFKVAVLDPGSITTEALRVEMANFTAPWAYRAANVTGTIRLSEPVSFLDTGATGRVRVWSTDEFNFPDLNIPAGDLGPNTPVGASEDAGGPGPIALSAGGVVVGGVGSAAYDLIVDGKTSVKSVVKGAILGGIGADVGAAVKAVEYGGKALKAAGGLLKKWFNCPNMSFEPGKPVIEDYVFESDVMIQTLEDDTQKAIKVYGRGDPLPGSPLGSNVVTATSLPF